ncbi:hypothetical protein RRG08_005749 [Elysia crispata]|uniref:Uncharacterized protein n=1 Tax=Elysia crispata TaxID=231223 RepID=A0AAE0YDS4_9GAST|nr:hypothetical protein RRG08_005749 [Elysia crispata]
MLVKQFLSPPPFPNIPPKNDKEKQSSNPLSISYDWESSEHHSAVESNLLTTEPRYFPPEPVTSLAPNASTKYKLQSSNGHLP